jgi:hypothetical protein
VCSISAIRNTTTLRTLETAGDLAQRARSARVLYGSTHAFFGGLIATAAGLVAGSSFLLRPPATGRSNDRWRRSAAGLARFSLAVMTPVAVVSCARLRFKAAIRSITGGGVMTSRGLIGRPFSSASMSALNPSW